MFSVKFTTITFVCNACWVFYYFYLLLIIGLCLFQHLSGANVCVCVRVFVHTSVYLSVWYTAYFPQSADNRRSGSSQLRMKDAHGCLFPVTAGGLDVFVGYDTTVCTSLSVSYIVALKRNRYSLLLPFYLWARVMLFTVVHYNNPRLKYRNSSRS